jgi:hypothetical protein
MMDLIRSSFVEGDVSSVAVDSSGIKLVDATEFGYVSRFGSLSSFLNTYCTGII